MIQAIKTSVNIGEELDKELCIDYEEDIVSFYLKDKFLFSMDYEDNFKLVMEMIKEKW